MTARGWFLMMLRSRNLMTRGGGCRWAGLVAELMRRRRAFPTVSEVED
jgi:hypothetical protein